jgi:hypothetical protein
MPWAALALLSLGGYLGVTSLSWLTDDDAEGASDLVVFGYIAASVIGAALLGAILIYALREAR